MSGGADWSLPTTGTLYTAVLGDLNDKDVDAITLQKTAPSNLPDGAIAWDRGASKFKEWVAASSAFTDMIVAIAGGGTGSSSASGARTALGLGSMATQSSTSVSISGGTISGVNIDAASLTSGTVAIARGGLGASLSLGASGTVLQSNGSGVVFGTDGSALTSLNASNLASGTVALARLPSGLGTVGQIQTGSSSTQKQDTSNTFTDSGLSVSITPSSSSHKISVFACLPIELLTNSSTLTNSSCDFRIKRNGSVVFTQTSVGGMINTTVSTDLLMPITLMFEDSPATTSACTYTIEFRLHTTGISATLSPGGTTTSVLYLIEHS